DFRNGAQVRRTRKLVAVLARGEAPLPPQQVHVREARGRLGGSTESFGDEPRRLVEAVGILIPLRQHVVDLDQERHVAGGERRVVRERQVAIGDLEGERALLQGAGGQRQ